MSARRLTLMIHGDAGHGKSWLADTAPGPRLLLDAEGRADYTPSRKVDWNPRQPPPADLGPADTAVVDVQDFDTVRLVQQWLASGQHPFKSVIIDSITELQQRVMDSVTGSPTIQPELQHWGNVLREMETFIRRMRDLRKHPTNPLWAFVVTAGSKERNAKQRALLAGQLADRVAYHFDVVGFLTRSLSADGGEERRLHIKPYGPIEAKDNTHLLSQHYGASIVDPNVEQMLLVLNPELAGPPASTPEPEEAPA